MKQPERAPLNWQQLLAAYADGELDAATCAEVRRWLDAHPDGYSWLEGQRGLSPGNVAYWESVRPPEPDAAAWARVWNRLEDALEPARPAARRRPPWWRRGLLAVAAAAPCMAAAAAVIAACVPEAPRPAAVAPPGPRTSDEAFQVAGSADVEILSIRDADAAQLVVGEPPFNKAMMLVAAGDVRLQEMQPARDGTVPEANMGGADAPLIYAPMPRTP